MNKKWIALIAIMMIVLLFGACANNDMQQEPDQVVEKPTETIEVETEDVIDDVIENDAKLSEDNADASEDESAVLEAPATEDSQTQADSGQMNEGNVSEMDLSALCTQMTTQLGATDAFVLDTASLMGLYGISAEVVKQSSGFVTMSGTFPDEIVMVEAVDEDAADTVQSCLQSPLVILKSKIENIPRLHRHIP